jgi:hypothetical protein
LDVDVHCTYIEFNGTFEDDTTPYYPMNRVSSIVGTAVVVHNDSLEEDFWLSSCPVVIDGIQYGAHLLDIPDGQEANVSSHGSGHMRVGDSLYPHIDGTLEVDRFVNLEDRGSDTYQTIRFRGDDIEVRTIDTSAYGTGGPFAFYDPWVIEVTVPRDATVEIEEPLKVPLWGEYVLMGCAAAVLVIIYREHT